MGSERGGRTCCRSRQGEDPSRRKPYPKLKLDRTGSLEPQRACKSCVPKELRKTHACVYHHQVRSGQGPPVRILIGGRTPIEDVHESPYAWGGLTLGLLVPGTAAAMMPAWPAQAQACQTGHAMGPWQWHARPHSSSIRCRRVSEQSSMHVAEYVGVNPAVLSKAMMPAAPVGSRTVWLHCNNGLLHGKLYETVFRRQDGLLSSCD